MSVQASSEFRQQTRSSIQEAANYFRQNKAGDAFDLLKIRISDQRKEFSEGQWQAFCKILHLNPKSEPVDFSKREFQTFPLLRAQALRDLVAECSKDSKGKEELEAVQKSILQAAQILETSGDMESAWKALNEVLPAAMRKKPSMFCDFIVRQVYRIMLDDIRKPSSHFLQQRLSFMAKALDSLSLHFFDEKLLKGQNPEISASLNPSLPTFSTLIPRQVCTLLAGEELNSLMHTSKAFSETAKSSLEFRNEATLEDLQKWLKEGALNKPLTALHVLKRKKDLPIDKRELESILTLCPNLKILDLGCGSNHITKDCLSVVGKCCPNLLSFSLTGFVNNNIDSGNEILIALSHCHMLRKVTLRSQGIITFSFDSMEQFLKGCKNLEDLGLEGFMLGDMVFLQIGKAGLPLKRIVISPAVDKNGFAIVRNTSAAYIGLFKGNPRLEEVILRNNPCLRDNALKELADHCPLITKLDVSNNGLITEEGLRSVVIKCNRLSHLFIDGFRGDISKVFEDVPSHLTNVTFKGVEIQPYQMIDFVRNNPHLINIQLPDGMTEEVLIGISQSCQNLKYLRVSGKDDLLRTKGWQDLAKTSKKWMGIY